MCFVVFIGEYDWYYYFDLDELFIVFEGELLIDFKDKEIVVFKVNDSLLILKGIVY